MRLYAAYGLLSLLIVFIITLCLHLYFQNSVNSESESNDNLQSNLKWLNNYVDIIDPEDIENFHQKDHRLLNYLRVKHLWPPSRQPYNGAIYNGGGDADITNAIRSAIEKLTPGFYVEAGAFDGIWSHTVKLELNHGWQGLLIECNPVLVPKILQLHRKAYFSNVCLSRSAKPQMTQLTSMDNWPASSSLGKGDIFPHHIESNFTKFDVMTVPLYSIIAAVGVNVVDFIALDIQSLEYEVLSHFPFQDILVKVWVIEVNLLSEKERFDLLFLMKNNGYKTLIVLHNDFVFIHKCVNI